MDFRQTEIDVVIISASRPKLLPFVVDSFDKFIHFDGKINKYLHEDFVYPEESEKVLKYCKTKGIKTYNHRPAQGIGNAIQFMLNECKSEFIFILQDDFEFELPIDLNHVLYVMDKNKHINNIYFNKRKNIKAISGFWFKEEEYDHLRICLTNQWPMFNGVWRKDFVKKRWALNDSKWTQESFWNRTLKEKDQNDHDFLKENIGCYMYGPLQWPRMIRHLGYTWSVKPQGTYPRKKDGYGGNAVKDLIKETKERAEWIPDEEDRPMYLENKKDQIEQFKKQNSKKNN